MESGTRSTMLSAFFFIVALLFTVVLANLPIAETLARFSFDDGTYSHAYLIPFITLYLYFNLAKKGFISYRNSMSYSAIALLALSCLALFVSSNAQISLGYWVAYILVMVFSVNTVFKFSWYTIFPAGYLVFIMPIWGILTTVLQKISTVVVTFLMGFSGIPTFVEGQFITIPAGAFEIADGCSGLRYFIVSLAISSLFTFLYIKNTKKALLFLSVAIAGALITNWIRITALILIGEYTNMQSPLMEDHNTFGWYLYIPFMIGLFYWGNKVADHDLFTGQTLNANKAMHLPSVVTALLLISLSSTTLNSMTASMPDQANNTIPTSVSVAPEMFYSTQVEHLASKNNSTYLIFHFNGRDLNSKATFYLNEVVPNGWEVEKSETVDNWLVHHIAKREKRALVLVQYRIENEATHSSGKFKALRLKYGVKNVRNTELHWQFKECSDRCNVDINSFVAQR